MFAMLLSFMALMSPSWRVTLLTALKTPMFLLLSALPYLLISWPHHSISFSLCYFLWPKLSLTPLLLIIVPRPQWKFALTVLTSTVLASYTACSFQIAAILADHDFECLWSTFSPTLFDNIPCNSHAPKVEHSIHTIKKSIQTCIYGLPFKCIPCVMHYLCHKLLNQLPRPNNPLLKHISPTTIVGYEIWLIYASF